MNYERYARIAKEFHELRDRDVGVDAMWHYVEATYGRCRDYGVICATLDAWAGEPSWARGRGLHEVRSEVRDAPVR